MTTRSDPKRMAELGRSGGLASGEARRNRKPRSVQDAIRAKIEANPDRVADQLLDSRNPRGAELALRLAGYERDEPVEPVAREGSLGRGASFAEVLKAMWESNPAALEAMLVAAGVLEPEGES